MCDLAAFMRQRAIKNSLPGRERVGERVSFKDTPLPSTSFVSRASCLLVPVIIVPVKVKG
jgi:hypothetical protein